MLKEFAATLSLALLKGSFVPRHANLSLKETFLRFFFFKFYYAGFGTPDYVRICSDNTGTEVVDCGDGFVRVDEAFAAHIPNVICDSPSPGLPGNPVDECRKELKNIYFK